MTVDDIVEREYKVTIDKIEILLKLTKDEKGKQVFIEKVTSPTFSDQHLCYYKAIDTFELSKKQYDDIFDKVYHK